MKQRTPEWDSARRGMITASRLGDVIARPDTDRRWRYIREVVADIVGSPDWQDSTPSWFKHGTEWESEAREFYEFMTGYIVQDAGFLRHPTVQYVGCSPDGLVGVDGGIELKCTYKIDVLEKTRSNGMPAIHKPQVQGNLWVTGRRWWDYAVYYKALDTSDCGISIHRIFPDPEYHERLASSCKKFWKDCEELANERFRGRWKNRQAQRTERKQQGYEVLSDEPSK